MVTSCTFNFPALIWILLCVLLLIPGTDTAGTCFIKVVDPEIRDQVKDVSDSVNIIEFDLIFQNYSTTFWNNVSGGSWYKPTRIYRCGSKTTERFLLLFHYYYGLFKSYVYVGLSQWQVNIVTDPLGCLQKKNRNEIQTILDNFILSGLSPSNGSSSVDVSDHSVCSMRIIDKAGWAYFGYRCCRVSSAGDLDCYEVTDDTWSWILRVLILTATVILFLYFPILIPRSFRMEVFSFSPKPTQTINIMTTRNLTMAAVGAPNTLIIPWKMCQKMEEFRKVVKNLPFDSPYNLEVKKLDFRIKFDRIVAENESPFGLFRALFDAFIRCKIRHTDVLDECCTTRICGQCSCSVCPPWYVVLQALRTILIFATLALPSLPLLYHLCDPYEEYWELVQMTRNLGLKETSSFSVGTTAGIVIVGVIAALYVAHIVVVVVDGVRDRNLSKLYGQLLNSRNARSTLQRTRKKVRSVIKNAVMPVQKLGILFLPLWIIFLVLSPVIIFIYFVVTSPVFRIGLRIFRLILGSFEKTKRGREELEHRFENLAFCLTIIAVFVVLTIGCNFLLHVLTMIIVNMIVNIKFTMRILPVVILIAFYIRDTFSSVGSTYHSYNKTILGLIMGEKSDECREIAMKPIEEQDNVMFQSGITPRDANNISDPLFLVNDNQLLMNTRGLLLFLHNEDVPYLCRKFLDQATEIDCHGSPGPVSESVKAAVFEFVRIIFFLFCLLIVVMAYGDISYISPEGQFFATFVTGLIPFALKKFFLNQDGCGALDTGNLRFTSQFEDMKNRFVQAWPLDDIVPMTEEDTTRPKTEPNSGSSSTTSTWNMKAILSRKQMPEKLGIDLIVDMTDFDITADVCGLDQDGTELNELDTCRHIPCFEPISVSP